MRIVIFGQGSYIGTHFAQYILAKDAQTRIDVLDAQSDAYKTYDFAGADAVLHVAGIVHRRETAENRGLYMQVNCDLAAAVAARAKAQGVGQYVYLSSMSVYGTNGGRDVRITHDTPPAPENAYGKSKLAAEQALFALADERFCVACLRPPMVYGKGCPGNYMQLQKVAMSSPFFPKADNRRSMVHIDILCAFLALVVRERAGGLLFPQNAEYVNPADMVRRIAACHGRKVRLVGGLRPLLRALVGKVGVVTKVFGDLVYDQALSDAFGGREQVRTYEETIRRTEQGDAAGA
nr:NAD-dependent epimerase/dehydratase family protein [Maliibacterium massiliense]